MRFFSPPDFMRHICNQIARIIIGTVPFLQNPGYIKKFYFKFTLFQLFFPSSSSSVFVWRRSVQIGLLLQIFPAVLPGCPASLPWQLMMHSALVTFDAKIINKSSMTESVKYLLCEMEMIVIPYKYIVLCLLYWTIFTLWAPV